MKEEPQPKRTTIQISKTKAVATKKQWEAFSKNNDKDCTAYTFLEKDNNKEKEKCLLSVLFLKKL